MISQLNSAVSGTVLYNQDLLAGEPPISPTATCLSPKINTQPGLCNDRSRHGPIFPCDVETKATLFIKLYEHSRSMVPELGVLIFLDQTRKETELISAAERFIVSSSSAGSVRILPKMARMRDRNDAISG